MERLIRCQEILVITLLLDKYFCFLGQMPARELAVCRGHEDWVSSVCVTEDGKIVSGSYDKTVECGICRAISLRYAGAMKMWLLQSV